MVIYRHLIFGSVALALSFAAAAGLSGCSGTASAAGSQDSKPQVTAPPVAPAPPPPVNAAANASANQEQRRTQLLIGQAELAFRSGEAHYRKGQLVQAKADFDSAVDMMLGSGLDIKADPLLDDEFNRILDAVNALEMDALKQGNGFAPTLEPAPSDVANDVTFEVDPNLVAKAKAELVTTKSDLPLVINDYVAGFINFFANSQRGHNTLKHSLERSGRYKAMIQRVLDQEGVPQDLIYLAVAESSFQPQAMNGHSGAGGMWQFMPHGDYGLARNGYVDERFDPEKSTRAYARYMKFIYDQLGDWYLAMAGYDWGSGNVQHAVQKTGYADYWELYKRNNLPGETKNYVPEILAAIIIAKNPTQYGFDDVQPDPAVVYDTVTIDYSVDLRLAADIVDAPPQELAALNPSLLRITTPPASLLTEPFALHLPVGTATLYEKRIAEIPEDRRTQWRYHRVLPDDTLESVAQSFHVSVEQLASVNQLDSVARTGSLSSVESLVIPVPPVATPTAHMESYKARRGDTLVTIADRFGVSLDDLRRWNHLSGSTVTAGQHVRVQAPLHLAPQTREKAPKSSRGGKAGKSGASGSGSAEKSADQKSASGGKAASEKQSTAGRGHHGRRSNSSHSSGTKAASAAAAPGNSAKSKSGTKPAAKSASGKETKPAVKKKSK
jgi:membrane-bound lytic murein transglycosylase D